MLLACTYHIPNLYIHTQVGSLTFCDIPDQGGHIPCKVTLMIGYDQLIY